MTRLIKICLLVVAPLVLSACEPEVGSERWCKAMKEKDKGDWTANEAADFMKHCIVEIKEY
ncbi:DUF3012 domain-containing protein [Kangiella sediminilitoris]|uniref:DUF3012 domain-containing protein n=1 Tax=Kangiella sediminilitoris TaxID=1144748 RepID=A0A1B3B9B3_9GAMM|nr:DUF3012 domain-containing protein [Kangiella sediminilitoris]AOE49336.1 hypothetical protein KS2013_612 [Kangiella sediminilitoris]